MKYRKSIERFCDATFGRINSQSVVIVCLVAPTHLKHISQIGNLPQIGVKINNIWNHQLVMFLKYQNSPILEPTHFQKSLDTLRQQEEKLKLTSGPGL